MFDLQYSLNCFDQDSKTNKFYKVDSGQNTLDESKSVIDNLRKTKIKKFVQGNLWLKNSAIYMPERVLITHLCDKSKEICSVTTN